MAMRRIRNFRNGNPTPRNALNHFDCRKWRIFSASQLVSAAAKKGNSFSSLVIHLFMLAIT